MKIKTHGSVSERRRSVWIVLAFVISSLFAGSALWAHSPLVDADLRDWCIGAFSNTYPAGGRTEDSAADLVCGVCNNAATRACEVSTDCPVGGTCINLTSKVELAWWDNRTDGAVNDLATVAVTQDNTNLYFAAELWVDPDPVSLPFAEIGINFRPGGIPAWYDPNSALTNPGTCSVSTDRACTSNADCHFCAISTEPAPSTRLRTCGSGCNPDIPADICNTSQTCTGVGSGGPQKNVGLFSNPVLAPDYMLVFDFSRWLIGAAGPVLVMRDVAGTWTPIGSFEPAVNPGASGGSGGPPGAVEVAIPWSVFGCTGCPGACVCPDFGPGQDFQFSLMVARGTLTLDYTPDGAYEDVMSEAVAGMTTTTTNSCPGFGIGNTACEIADASTDAFIPQPAAVPGGRIDGLTLDKAVAPGITLNWNASCSGADTDYGIYEGTVGSWYSHTALPGLCTTLGLTTATFTPGAGNRYYLVVPTDAATEGSYGEDSATAERPVGTTACHVQSLGNCP